MRLDQLGIYALNFLMIALCAFFVARIVNQLIGHAIAPDPAAAVAAVAPVPPPTRSWEQRQVILDRNLFNVSTLAPAAGTQPQDVAEQLEATKLPLRLLGTAAGSDPRLSWAAVEDLDSRAHLVVRVGSTVKDKAKVVRIERRRIVLENGKRHEELALEEGPQTAQAGGPRPRNVANRPARPPAPNAQDLSERVKRLAENRFQVQRSDVEEVARNPAQLFSQARILPKYENGQMTGVQLNAIRPGSLFEQIGIQNGDTIVEFNGLKIDSPEQSAELLREFQESKQFNVTVQRSNGEQVPLTYELSE